MEAGKCGLPGPQLKEWGFLVCFGKQLVISVIEAFDIEQGFALDTEGVLNGQQSFCSPRTKQSFLWNQVVPGLPTLIIYFTIDKQS